MNRDAVNRGELDRETLLQQAERFLNNIDVHSSAAVRVELAKAWIMLAQAKSTSNSAKLREELRAELRAELRRELYDDLFDRLSARLSREVKDR